MNLQPLDAVLGQPIEVEDSSALDQCMDLAFYYLDKSGISHSAIRNGYAFQVWSNFDTSKLERITGTPQPGDLAIWGTQVGTAGHIAIVKSWNGNGFTSYDQNWEGVQKVRLVNHNMFGVLGFLRIKGKGAGVIIQNGDNWFARLSQLQRQVQGTSVPFTRDNFNWWVGKDTLTFIEALSDSKEAQWRENAGNVGEVAVKDKWDQQIYTLQDQVKAANEKVSKLQTQIDDLSSKLATQSDDTKLLNGFGEFLSKMIIRLGLKK